jgi:Rrf2 family iron-sulfur cluster assembly transcriptional regulator
MRLTTKGRYAVTAMLDLALHREQGAITLADISGRQDISLSYLEQLFSRLRRGGLVVSSRGPGGGYRLSRELAEISVSDVIAAVDESGDATRCGGKGNCQGDARCLTHDLWQELSGEIQDFLQGVTLQGLVNQRGVREVSERQDRETAGPEEEFELEVDLTPFLESPAAEARADSSR